MPAGPVIANNTPLVALWVLDRLDLLRDLFSEVLISETVRAEFLATESERRQVALAAASWIKTVSLSEPRRAMVYVGLDQGEAEALALAEERNASLVIMDERKGRRYAHRLGIPVTGTLGVLLLAKEQGLISAVKPFVTQLLGAGLYLTPELVSQALQIANEPE